MESSQDRLKKMTDLIREKGHRLTNQRLAVLKILAESKEHPSVESIYKEVKKDFPVTSLATIYKTINLLKSYDEVMELGFADKGSRYDGFRPYPHPHVICTKCGKIVDSETDVDILESRVRENTGFEIKSHRVDFFGLCPQCVKSS